MGGRVWSGDSLEGGSILFLDTPTVVLTASFHLIMNNPFLLAGHTFILSSASTVTNYE